MNAYNTKGKQFIGAINELVKDEGRENFDVLFETLNSISLKDGVHLGLKLASKRGLGDESCFYTVKNGVDPSRGKEPLFINAVFPDLKVEKSEMGAWQAYLLFVSPTILPVFWHGGYICRDYFFDASDVDMFNQESYEDTPELSVDEIPEPSVAVEDDKYVVSCAYWNDWEGLVRETVRVKFLKNGDVTILVPKQKVLKRYNCGICY